MFWRVLSGLSAMSFAVQFGTLVNGGAPNRVHVGLALLGMVLVSAKFAMTGDE